MGDALEADDALAMCQGFRVPVIDSDERQGRMSYEQCTLGTMLAARLARALEKCDAGIFLL
jgi:hypothetical protein